ncbi:MAG: hypothetical protein KDK10_04345 [Maritimibacter sp.]|nr:hypothetical protein [Maritimibacter sp.]
MIGNSHVGMLRAAAQSGWRGPPLVYFAKAGGGIERARVRGSVIIADDPDLVAAQRRYGLPTEIDVADCEAVIFVAGTASLFNAAQVLQSHRLSDPVGPGGGGSAGAELAERDPRQLLSQAAFVDALADRARAGYSHRFATALRRATGVPMFLVPQPFPGEAVLDAPPPHGPLFRRLRASGEGAAVVAPLALALERAFAGIEGLHLLLQPEDTVAHGFLTARAFTRDAVRVNGATPQHGGDFLHVGAVFGSRVLDRVATVLNG